LHNIVDHSHIVRFVSSFIPAGLMGKVRAVALMGADCMERRQEVFGAWCAGAANAFFAKLPGSTNVSPPTQRNCPNQPGNPASEAHEADGVLSAGHSRPTSEVPEATGTVALLPA
jgi:hypothetical protein